MSFFERSSSVLTLSPQPVHRAFTRMSSPVNAFNRFQAPPPRSGSPSLGALAANRKRCRDDDDEGTPDVDHNRSRRIAMPSKRFSNMSSQSMPNLQVNQPIDELTLHLGIGWRRMSTEEHIQAAARGWARYIEMHYPLTNVIISLESKSLQSYLIESNEGFFLFSEDLRQGRLVSRTREGVFVALKNSPPVFDPSSYVMMASNSARIATSVKPNSMQVC